MLTLIIEGGVPEVGELMNASFPADGKLIGYVSAKNSWYLLFFIFLSMLLPHCSKRAVFICCASSLSFSTNLGV